MTTAQDGSTTRMSTQPLSRRHRALPSLRLTAGAVVLALAACGGGSSPGPVALGVVSLTVTDTYGTPVADASVTGPHGLSTTDALGVALVLVDAPGSSAQVTVSRDSFVDGSFTATSVPDRVNEVHAVLQRATSAAGGSLPSRSGVPPVRDVDGQWLQFEVELVVVGGDARAIDTLSRADFVLRPCVPDPTNARFDCLRGGVASDDVAYTPDTPTPEAATRVPGAAARPYASTLLLDQSGSIQRSDPTGARLFSVKAFLDGLQGQDQALLAAFADGPGALLPSLPLTVYGPFRAPGPARDYFATLDALAPLVGGSTPLYASIDTLRQQSLPAGVGRALVVFTDGADTDCPDPEACRLRRAQSIDDARRDQVRIFAVGLSGGVDMAALGELAHQTGGALLYADHAARLLPLYGSAGRLMSLSLPTYRLRWTVRADRPGAFRPGQALLGWVQVSAEGSRFDVPFVVGLP